jgi:hypothetical protein
MTLCACQWQAVQGEGDQRDSGRNACESVTALMDPIRFVEQHGVVLEGARGPRPNLADAVAGERIHGSWWGHKKGRAIFLATRTVRDCDQVLVCRLVGGKITYVHHRLWPAIVRLANSLDKKTLVALKEEHTLSGAHRVRTIPFPRWVPPEVRQAAKNISEEQAHLQLGDWIKLYLRKGQRA